MDLSTPNTREKYLLKTKCLQIFSLQATAVDRCAAAVAWIDISRHCLNSADQHEAVKNQNKNAVEVFTREKKIKLLKKCDKSMKSVK